MEIKQESKVALSVELNDKEYLLYIEANTSLGELHDVLLYMKGTVVESMLSAQKQEKEVSEFVNNETDVPPEELQKPEEEVAEEAKIEAIPEVQE